LFGFDSGGRVAGRQPRTGPDPDNRPGTRHRHPVGSHAAVTPANPAAPRGGARAPTSTRRRRCRCCRPTGLGVAMKCAASVGCIGVLSTGA